MTEILRHGLTRLRRNKKMFDLFFCEILSNEESGNECSNSAASMVMVDKSPKCPGLAFYSFTKSKLNSKTKKATLHKSLFTLYIFS